MTVQKLKDAVRKLSPKERILFVQYILDTVAEDTVGDKEEPLTDEWKGELERRSAAYQNDEAKTHTWEEVKVRLLRKYS